MPQDDQLFVLMSFAMLAAILALLGLMVGASKLIRWRRLGVNKNGLWWVREN